MLINKAAAGHGRWCSVVALQQHSECTMKHGDRSGAALITARPQRLAQVPRNTPTELLRARRCARACLFDGLIS